MGYLREFKEAIHKRNQSKLGSLWEEYCLNDTVDGDELVHILELIKESEFAPSFGKFTESALDLLEKISDGELRYRNLKALIDLETSNSPLLAEKAVEALNSRYGESEEHSERLKLVGLREMVSFQGALSNYELLAHMRIGNCVYHRGGWGTGEIVDISKIREQVIIEFDNVPGRKDFTFLHAFRNLIPLPADHFLARRFVDPDTLEDEAREDPIAVIKLLLKDLGPKSAPEIKDELCELVIPEKDWSKWWQATRNKLKKDTLIKVPDNLRDPFVLRKEELTHQERLEKEMEKAGGNFEVILASYNFIRDFPNMAKKDEVKIALKDKLSNLLVNETITLAEKLQIYLFMEQLFDQEAGSGSEAVKLISETEKIVPLIEEIGIQALKKRAVAVIRESRQDWIALFLALLPVTSQGVLREYLIVELNKGEGKEQLKKKIEEILQSPTKAPDMVIWYLQKLLSGEGGLHDLPFNDKEGQCAFAEALLVLLYKIEHDPKHRDHAKKIHTLLTSGRYAAVRKIFEGSSSAFTQEFLLLASKCHLFAGQDMMIFNSLAQVAHPSLSDGSASQEESTLSGHILWTSEEGYRRTQERAQYLGTVEIVKNAKEVEAARALGDLSENAEYKFAVERRRQLQGELKTLLEQINRARIITVQDISLSEIGIGNVITLARNGEEQVTYTILGPWDADADKNILSFQSKLAQAMVGKKAGDRFTFKDKDYSVVAIESFLDKKTAT